MATFFGIELNFDHFLNEPMTSTEGARAGLAHAYDRAAFRLEYQLDVSGMNHIQELAPAIRFRNQHLNDDPTPLGRAELDAYISDVIYDEGIEGIKGRLSGFIWEKQSDKLNNKGKRLSSLDALNVLPKPDQQVLYAIGGKYA